ncbi:histone-lysine N-methyltransferase SETMAR [Trichonephila clavipes]|nr:histone-lysine N-methyltransferase SETMAR [Trichonephila clavipes]
MNALAYVDVLRHNLLDSTKKLIMENTFIFQQDNDPKHTAIVTKTWLLYHAPRKGKNAVQARKKLTDVYGEGVLTVRQCQNWFAKFRSGNFDVEDAWESRLKLIKTR